MEKDKKWFVNIKWNDGQSSTLETGTCPENKKDAFWEYKNKYRKSGEVWISTRGTKEYYEKQKN